MIRSIRLFAVFLMSSIVLYPIAQEFQFDAKEGVVALHILTWDFVDNFIFVFGLFFMAVYVIGRLNRLAIYAFALIAAALGVYK